MKVAGTTGREGFTGELWRSIEDIYARILDHPFLAGLTDGTLPEEKFKHYVLQDTLYLRDYARALSLAAVRAPGADALVMFNEHAAGAITVERSLHDGFLKEFGLPEDIVDRTPLAPTTLAYTSYTIRTATLGDYPEVLAAVLPCYWIYERVGKTLLEHGSPKPIYQKWIDTYAGDEFGALVEAVLDLTDQSSEGLSPLAKARSTEAFVTSSRYEWMFWDAAWRLEGWPV